MPEPQEDDHGALTTTTIFDDAVYCAEALCLAGDQNEDDADAELALLAAESGIQDPYRFLYAPKDISRALSTATLDSDLRSSASIHSQETQSTSFTSPPSRTSRDQASNSERLSSMRGPPTPARASPTVEHQDPSDDPAPSNLPARASSSTLSVSKSLLSDSSSSSAPLPRRKRASGLFGMFRKSSGYESRTSGTMHHTNLLCSSCPSQSHHGYHGKARAPRLECGHSLSPSAIRIHVQEALDRGEVVPSCCGKPLPRSVLEITLVKEEAEMITKRAISTPVVETVRDSGYGEQCLSTANISRPLDATPLSPTSTSLPTVMNRRRHEVINIESALANEAFKSFRNQEKEQFERISTFECNQRKALSAHHASSLQRLAARQKALRAAKMEQHVQDLERQEEAQIVAEHDLRQAHNVETQNVATALKHMEAYCLGSGISHPDHPHVVTEEDFKKLDRQRMVQQGLPRKHGNAINVLRAKQERDIKKKLEKQREDLECLGAAHEEERAAEEMEHVNEMVRLEKLMEERRKRLMQRWDLKFEMWRRDWEHQHGTPVTLRLEHEMWPLQTTKTMTPIPETSSLAPYVQTMA
ncbi:hypothetical protein DE146DRAFT_431864 [Phaeosphaeria sp. MPI-PUGE-AT-0046c]|nr:hypothetical protein DE146DRAFT_431864 [Phaeosphaeria sp. MPI-PUGE-AT-0046c]